MAQLQALRQRLNRSRGDLRATEEWITELLNREKGTELWPPAALKKWLSLIAEKTTAKDENGVVQEADNHRIWTILSDYEETWPWLTLQGENRLRAELRGEAIQTVFDACLRAHHRAQQT